MVTLKIIKYESSLKKLIIYPQTDFHLGRCSSANTKVNEEALAAFSTQKKIVKNQLITTFPKLSKSFEVSFEVYPTSFISGWGNILHFTAGGDVHVYGDRVPGVWFHPSSPAAKTNKLHICSAISGHVNYCYNSGSFLLNEWIKIKISQIKKSDSYEYTVYINGKVVTQVKNSRPVYFDNVKLYVGDPWYNAQPGYVRNIKVNGKSKFMYL